jgi:hypothetical protein
MENRFDALGFWSCERIKYVSESRIAGQYVNLSIDYDLL